LGLRIIKGADELTSDLRRVIYRLEHGPRPTSFTSRKWAQINLTEALFGTTTHTELITELDTAMGCSVSRGIGWIFSDMTTYAVRQVTGEALRRRLRPHDTGESAEIRLAGIAEKHIKEPAKEVDSTVLAALLAEFAVPTTVTFRTGVVDSDEEAAGATWYALFNAAAYNHVFAANVSKYISETYDFRIMGLADFHEWAVANPVQLNAVLRHFAAELAGLDIRRSPEYKAIDGVEEYEREPME
jgi:hypothetical protein